MEETKTCDACRETFSLDQFVYNSTYGYYTNKCRPCWNEYYRKSEAERRRNDYFQILVNKKKYQSKMKGFYFNLTKEYLEELWYKQKGLCAVLNIPIYIHDPIDRETKATLDRKVPAKGYTMGNVSFICEIANRIKNNCTDPEVFLKVAEYVRKTNLQEQPEFDFSFTN